MEKMMCGECGGHEFKVFIRAGSYDLPDEVLLLCAKQDCAGAFLLKPEAHIRMAWTNKPELLEKYFTKGAT